MWIHCTVHRTIFCASHLSRLTSEFASVRFSFLVNHIVWKHKNYSSLLMNNSLVHEENRNKTQVLELIPYFHFFSSSKGGAVQWRNFDDRLFECQLFHYLFNQETTQYFHNHNVILHIYGIFFGRLNSNNFYDSIKKVR